jgi:hypothetical protein
VTGREMAGSAGGESAAKSSQERDLYGSV